MNQEILFSLISVIGGFILGVLTNVIRDMWYEKYRHRSLITVDTIYNIGVNLEGYPIKDVAKVAYTKTYSDIVKFQDKNSDIKLYSNFIIIKNSDSSSINNLHFKSYQTTHLDGIEDWEVEVNVSVLQKSETIFINIDNFLNNEEKVMFSIDIIEIHYDTSHGERIKYESYLKVDGTIRETYYIVRKWFKNKKILEINNKGIDWVLIPKNNDRT